MQQRPRIVLLYADPLVDITNDGQNQTPSVPLDFVNELSKAYDAVLGSGVDIDCQFHIATPNNFLDALWDKNVRLIHLSGHGEANHIVLDDAEGSSTRSNLRTLQNSPNWGEARRQEDDQPNGGGVQGDGGRPKKLVVLSSCHSEDAGKMLLDLGIDFVVCIQRHEKLSDQGASDFAKNFYSKLLAGRTVGDALNYAITMMAIPSTQQAYAEGSKYKLLMRPSVARSDYLFESLATCDQSVLASRIHIPPRIKRIAPRYTEPLMQVKHTPRLSVDQYERPIAQEMVLRSIVHTLLNERQQSKRVLLLGEKWAGKTTAARFLAHYIRERLPKPEKHVICITMVAEEVKSFLSIPDDVTNDRQALTHTYKYFCANYHEHPDGLGAQSSFVCDGPPQTIPSQSVLDGLRHLKATYHDQPWLVNASAISAKGLAFLYLRAAFIACGSFFPLDASGGIVTSSLSHPAISTGVHPSIRGGESLVSPTEGADPNLQTTTRQFSAMTLGETKDDVGHEGESRSFHSNPTYPGETCTSPLGNGGSGGDVNGNNFTLVDLHKQDWFLIIDDFDELVRIRHLTIPSSPQQSHLGHPMSTLTSRTRHLGNIASHVYWYLEKLAQRMQSLRLLLTTTDQLALVREDFSCREASLAPIESALDKARLFERRMPRSWTSADFDSNSFGGYQSTVQRLASHRICRFLLPTNPGKIVTIAARLAGGRVSLNDLCNSLTSEQQANAMRHPVTCPTGSTTPTSPNGNPTSGSALSILFRPSLTPTMTFSGGPFDATTGGTMLPSMHALRLTSDPSNPSFPSFSPSTLAPQHSLPFTSSTALPHTSLPTSGAATPLAGPTTMTSPTGHPSTHPSNFSLGPRRQSGSAVSPSVFQPFDPQPSTGCPTNNTGPVSIGHGGGLTGVGLVNGSSPSPQPLNTNTIPTTTSMTLPAPNTHSSGSDPSDQDLLSLAESQWSQSIGRLFIQWVYGSVTLTSRSPSNGTTQDLRYIATNATTTTGTLIRVLDDRALQVLWAKWRTQQRSQGSTQGAQSFLDWFRCACQIIANNIGLWHGGVLFGFASRATVDAELSQRLIVAERTHDHPFDGNGTDRRGGNDNVLAQQDRNAHLGLALVRLSDSVSSAVAIGNIISVTDPETKLRKYTLDHYLIRYSHGAYTVKGSDHRHATLRDCLVAVDRFKIYLVFTNTGLRVMSREVALELPTSSPASPLTTVSSTGISASTSGGGRSDAMDPRQVYPDYANDTSTSNVAPVSGRVGAVTPTTTSTSTTTTTTTTTTPIPTAAVPATATATTVTATANHHGDSQIPNESSPHR